jgi:hypothetical protein
MLKIFVRVKDFALREAVFRLYLYNESPLHNFRGRQSLRNGRGPRWLPTWRNTENICLHARILDHPKAIHFPCKHLVDDFGFLLCPFNYIKIKIIRRLTNYKSSKTAVPSSHVACTYCDSCLCMGHVLLFQNQATALTFGLPATIYLIQ